jgi:hypothetical protein
MLTYTDILITLQTPHIKEATDSNHMISKIIKIHVKNFFWNYSDCGRLI